MPKIKVDNPVVEIDGDEMARVMWHLVRDKLILPFLDVDLKYFDLDILHRDETDDKVTLEAAEAVRKYHVGIKCATITADESRVAEFKLKNRAWKSPNASIRSILSGISIFREPILCRNIPHAVSGWKRPIVIARHANGDHYTATEFVAPSAGRLRLVFTPSSSAPSTTVSSSVSSSVPLYVASSAQPIEVEVAVFKSGGGCALAMHNTDESITAFAHSCMRYALAALVDLFLSTKSTIMKRYDGRFREIFAKVYAESYEADFRRSGITYEFREIDDMMAFVVRSSGGFVWALKNLDGDVASGLVSEGFGSVGMMTSSLVCCDGTTVVTESAHGTVRRHFAAHRSGGGATSTNSVATIFAWSRGLLHRAKIDSNASLRNFAETLERVVVETIEGGVMTRDLAVRIYGEERLTPDRFVTTEGFVESVATNLHSALRM